jgi:hypothetical protein
MIINVYNNKCSYSSICIWIKKTYEPVYAIISYVVIIAVAVPFPKIIKAPCKAAKHLGA